MIQLSLRFPAGRFHATPWDHHVNEGVVEWPPSPWRLLRALVATLHERGDGLDKEAAWAAVTKLTAPPSFTLPPASVGHTRHYLSQNDLDRAKTALTFDAFVVTSDVTSVAVVHWPCDLSESEQRALAPLLTRLSYFGRAESWCEARWLDRGETDVPNCVPSDGTSMRETETVRVLCPAPGVTRADLERTTAEIQREGWSDPPGTRWVFYRRPADGLRAVASPPRQTRPEKLPTMAELVLGGTVLPLFTDLVKVAEQVRAAALSLHEEPSATLAGKASDGTPLRSQHRHAHYVPDMRGRAKRVTHVLVWAPQGLTASEQQALARISYLTQDGNRPALDVVLNGFGQPADFASACRLVGPARRWRSRTPFVLSRHVRPGRESAQAQLVRELRFRRFPEPVEIRALRGAALTDPRSGRVALTRWIDFDIRRRWQRPTTAYGGFEIVFDTPQQGPILLGFGSHYGLGQFEAVD